MEPGYKGSLIKISLGCDKALISTLCKECIGYSYRNGGIRQV